MERNHCSERAFLKADVAAFPPHNLEAAFLEGRHKLLAG